MTATSALNWLRPPGKFFFQTANSDAVGGRILLP